MNLTETVTENYIYKNYNISLCLIYNNSIFINIINNITYQTYETIVNNYDLSDILTIETFYQMLTRTFNKIDNYNLIFELDSNSLKLHFTTILDGFFTLNQTIILQEKILSNDSSLTMKLTEIEIKFKKEIDLLQKHIYNLENEEIIFAFHPQKFNDFIKYHKNTEEFDFTKFNAYYMTGDYIDFNKLYNLRNIKMFSNNFKYTSIKEIPLNWTINNAGDNSHIIGFGCGIYSNSASAHNYHNYINNIFDTTVIHLPSVEYLEIHFRGDTGVPNNNLRSLPNLTILKFIDYVNNSLDSFELIKNLKIKKLEYVNCLNIQNLEQIKNWCDSKNIKLVIK